MHQDLPDIFTEVADMMADLQETHKHPAWQGGEMMGDPEAS